MEIIHSRKGNYILYNLLILITKEKFESKTSEKEREWVSVLGLQADWLLYNLFSRDTYILGMKRIRVHTWLLVSPVCFASMCLSESLGYLSSTRSKKFVTKLIKLKSSQCMHIYARYHILVRSYTENYYWNLVLKVGEVSKMVFIMFMF
jgi:hypothetical protein